MPSWVWNEEIAKGEEIVIFDLDGVISDASHRQHFLEKKDKDWKGFFAACPNDPPIPSGVELTHLLSNIKSIIILTARPVSVQAQTIEWLKKYGVAWKALIMKSAEDPDLSSEMKLLALQEIRDANLKPILIFDDDPRNITMFKEQEVPTMSIYSGYYA
ncbi:MAG: hypothetical protein VX353_00745 [Actinomycetota bacterium]